MINIYLSNTLSGCSAKMLDVLETGKDDFNHILIVPDRFTLSMESKLMRRIGSTLNIEVMTFSRLAMRILEGRTKKCLSPEGAVMLLTKTVDKCRNSLLCYSKMTGITGFANEMYASVSAIRNSGISVGQLEEAVKSLKGYVKEKTKDIIVIYKNYLAELQENYTDSTTRLEALCGYIKRSAFVAGAEFYFSDFYAFSGKQYDIIKELMRCAKAVHIGAIAEVGGENRRIYPVAVKKRLEAMAKECGAKVNIISAFEKLAPDKQVIENHIFGYGAAKFNKSDYVSLYCASSMEEELEYICNRICEAVREQSMRYKDIAVVCGDLISYSPVACKVFARFGIPYFVDDRVLLSGEALIRQLLNYIRIMITNYSQNAVLEYAKNYFAEIDAAAFENFCIKYAIDYSRFRAPFTIGEQEELDIVEPIRAKLIAELLPLPENAKIGYYIEKLYEYINHNNFDNKLKEFAAKQRSGGYIGGEARSAQVPVKLRELLLQLEELMGDEERSLVQFYELFRTGLESTKIALIPQSADCVYIGECEDSRYDDKKILFIAGATDGAIPYDSRDNGILGEKEYIAWQAADIVVKPTAREKSMYSRFYAEQLLIKPTQKLYVGYSILDEKGGRNSSSVIINQLSYMFDLPIQKVNLSSEHRVYTPKNAYKRVISGIRELRRGVIDADSISYSDTVFYLLPVKERQRLEAILEGKADTLATGSGLFFKKSHTSISQLECYFCCPYRHFVRYGLLAKEREKGEIEARETGTVIHDMLEEYFRSTRNFNISGQEIHSKVNGIIDKLFEKPRFASMLESINAVQLERLRKECLQLAVDLTVLMRQSDFVPYEFEVKFGDKDNSGYDGIKLMDNRIELVGKIDRIDKYDNNVAVIDYKTGKADSDLKYVYYGKKIQLYAYLGALKQAGKTPAAAFYLPLKAEYSKEERADSRYCYSGQLVNDTRLINAFDNKLIEKGKSPIIPVEYKELKGFVAGKNILLKRENMDNIIAYVIKLASRAAEEILEGNIVANPAKDECLYCSAKDFCGYDKATTNERAVSAVDLDSFEVNYDC
ncbi:MAG: hypothetical protein EOM87_02635 [Clostridia bacterium]|nr:hypothetical protein [Clostridia bacterium]